MGSKARAGRQNIGGIHQDDLIEQLDEFAEALGREGVPVVKGSVLNDALSELPRLKAMREGRLPYDHTVDARDRWRAMLGLVDTARKVLAVRENPSFPALIPHFRYFANARTVQSLAQNTPSTHNDQESNHLFELLAGATVMQFATDVSLDPPQSDGSNPDVMFTFRGHRWAIACKTMDSDKTRTLVRRVNEGAHQIKKSNAEKGFVLVNLKNIFPHNELWRKLSPRDKPVEYEAWTSIEPATARMRQLFETTVLNPLRAKASSKALQIPVSGNSRALPVLACYVHSTASLKVGTESRFLPLVHIHRLMIGHRARQQMRGWHSKSKDLIDRLARAMQWREAA